METATHRGPAPALRHVAPAALPAGSGPRRWISRLGTALGLLLWLLAGPAPAQQKRTVARALPADPEPPVPLTKVSSIRSLSKERALQRLPVKLKGTITFRAPGRRLTFLSDGTGGISLELTDDAETDELLDLPPGTKVEVEGVTGFGIFAPLVQSPDGEPLKITKIENTSGAPAEPFSAKPVSPHQLADPRYHGELIEVPGVVRSVRTSPAPGLSNGRDVILRIGAIGSRKFTAIMLDCSEAESELQRFIGQEVKVRGVFKAVANDNGQFLGSHLYISSPRDIVSMPKDSSEIGGRASRNIPVPETPIASLMRFSGAPGATTRAKVTGVVTVVLDDRGFFIQDDTGGMWVEGDDLPELRVRDQVEATGFLEFGSWNPILTDASLRISPQGPANLPEPKDITAKQALSGHYDGMLVRFQAKVAEFHRTADRPALVLDSGGDVFEARLPDQQAAGPLESLERDTIVRVTGVCVNAGAPELTLDLSRPETQGQKPDRFHLEIPDASALIVVRPPPWWTTPRLLVALGLALFLLAGAVGWVRALRRRVAEQTEVIRLQTHRESVLAERARIARDLHDSLEQELVGLQIQLDVAAIQPDMPGGAVQAVETARSLLRHTRDEARLSIWDLRSATLEQDGLIAALRECTRALATPGGIDIQVGSEGDPRRLPGTLEAGLLRIGQEAVTNAVKHAKPRFIEAKLFFEPEQVILEVEDDGNGFDTAHAATITSGHYGLMGMRERAEKLGARLSLTSRPGGGTRIYVAVAA